MITPTIETVSVDDWQLPNDVSSVELESSDRAPGVLQLSCHRSPHFHNFILIKQKTKNVFSDSAFFLLKRKTLELRRGGEQLNELRRDCRRRTGELWTERIGGGGRRREDPPPCQIFEQSATRTLVLHSVSLRRNGSSPLWETGNELIFRSFFFLSEELEFESRLVFWLGLGLLDREREVHGLWQKSRQPSWIAGAGYGEAYLPLLASWRLSSSTAFYRWLNFVSLSRCLFGSISIFLGITSKSVHDLACDQNGSISWLL